MHALCLHNFSVCNPEWRSLGTRLGWWGGLVAWSHSQTLSTVHKWYENGTAVETICEAICEGLPCDISFSFSSILL